MLWRVLAFAVALNVGAAWAQDDDSKDVGGGGQNVGWETGLLIGNLLPNQIGGVTEITGMGGFRAGYRLGPTSFGESTFISGNGHGVEWKNLSASIRMDIPVENFVGIAYVGPDMTYYKNANSSSNRMIFGGHVGGGIQVRMGGTAWLRADMKFGLSPGTSMFIGLGLNFRFPGGGGSGAG